MDSMCPGEPDMQHYRRNGGLPLCSKFQRSSLLRASLERKSKTAPLISAGLSAIFYHFRVFQMARGCSGPPERDNPQFE